MRAAEACLYLVLLGAPLAFGCVEPWSRALLELGCFAAALSCLLRPERGAPARAPLLAVLAVAGLGAVQLWRAIAPLDPRPSAPFTVSAFATRETLLLWCAYAALVWSVPRAVRDPASARRFARAVVGSGVVVAVVGLAQAAAGTAEIYGLRYVRADANFFGPFYNRDHAADLLAVSFAVGCGLFASRFHKLEHGAASPDWLRAQAATAAALALIGAALAVCGSRGAAAGLGAAALASGWSAARRVAAPRRRRAAAAALVAAGAAAGVLGYLTLARQVRSTGTFEPSTAHRVALNRSGLRMLAAAPVFGWGLGASPYAFPAFQETDVPAAALYVHDDWLQLALDCGVAGAGAFAALGLAFWLASGRLAARARSREMAALIGGGRAALVVFVVHCGLDFCSQVPADAALALAVAGWLSGAGAWADKGPPARGRWPRWRWGLAAPLATCAAACVPVLAGAWHARRADLARLEERPKHFSRALAWDARPKYEFQLGLALLDCAAALPEERRAAPLSAALEHAQRALAAEPLNARFLDLNGAVLWQLGREDESRAFAERAQRVRFDPIVPLQEARDTADTRLDALRALGLVQDAAP